MKTTANLVLLASFLAPVAHSKTIFGTLKPRPEIDAQIQMIRDTNWAKAMRNAVVSDRACYNPSSEYMVQLAGNIGIEDLTILTDTGLDMLPMIYSLYRDSEGADQEYFGTFGEETAEITTAFDTCQEFWSSATGGTKLTTGNIKLLGMHGADMKDMSKLLATLQVMFDLGGTGLTYEELAIEVQDFIETLPHEYDNPILTFNAYASSTPGDERIVMGDGIIEYQHFKNLGKDGPEYILGHEFGHQMQYETNMIGGESALSPEESRSVELFADALGGYFLAHPKGENMEGAQVTELYEAAFAVGDCDESSSGHHGTPAQRECACIWGTNMAKASSGLRGHVAHPDDLAQLFDDDLHRILALDETLCQPPTSSSLDSVRDAVDNKDAVAGAGEVTTVTTTTTVVTTSTAPANV